MSLEKLKDTARKFEQKEDWRKAIEVYLKAIQQIESGKDTTPDLSLYNRVGDLYLKVGDTAAAVRHYERAVELYADQGFFNNAIALCGKILRVNPGRTTTYLHLARLHARKNVVIEAKRNLLEYLERMNAQGQLDEAFGALKAFADQFSASQDIRVMLVELLRAASRGEEAQEQLEKLCTDLEARGDASAAKVVRERLEVEPHDGAHPAGRRGGDLVFIDTGFGIPPPGRDAPAKEAPAEPVVSLVEEPTLDAGSSEGLAPPESVGGFEATSIEVSPEADIGAPTAEGLEGLIEEVRTVDFEGVHLAGMEDALGLDPAADASLSVPSAGPDLDLSDVLAESLADTPPADAFAEEAAEVAPIELDFIEPEAAEPEPTETAAQAVAETVGSPEAASPPPAAAAQEPAALASAPADPIRVLEQAVADRPDDPEAHRALGEALQAAGDARRAADEFLFGAEACEAREAWQDAGDLMARVVALEPNDVRHYQKLVELAYRTGSRDRMLDAYLALAATLRRVGEVEKSIAVYRRVSDHDPANRAAREALAEMGFAVPPPPAPPQAPPPARPKLPTVPPAAPRPPAGGRQNDFVDLGSMVLEEAVPRDTRMRIESARPTDDEQKNFEEMLAEFKRGIEQNLDADDYQSHYDLGVAYKEMGLLDEAIAEFQKALRSPEGRLRASEALGVAFFDKGQFGIAETVLRRAADGETGGDEAKIGVLYWLGRAAEAQGKTPDALRCYERALAVDIRFMDLGERVPRLTAERQA
jgi:tetratricopeptide (TPR) repeat protein